MKRFYPFLLCTLMLVSQSVYPNTPVESKKSPKEIDKTIVKAVRLNHKILLDGKLTESIWKNNGCCISCFKQRDPIEGAEPTERTEVMIAYSEEALYIGARMFDSSPDSIVGLLGRRDAYLSADEFSIYIDSYNDERSGYYFGINAAGSISDGIMSNDEWQDDSWDGVWEGKVDRDEKGWTAELMIPFSQLRFHKNDRYCWGINFRRYIQRKAESNYVVYTPKDGSGFVSRFPDLEGIEGISPSRHLEILPYVRTKAEFTHPEPGDPFNDGSHFPSGIGADIKIGLGNNLTLDATINPDFGQVEVDPAVINLSDIETYYSEKRPFFIEGSNIFRFGHGGANSWLSLNWPSPNLFYSRRIGRPPQGSLPDYDFADVPEGANILGAAKLSGKLGGSWNVGAISAVTGRAKADIELNRAQSRTEVEPLTYYGVYRAQKEFSESRHALGFMSTIVQRRFGDARLRDELNSGAYTFGLDGYTFLDEEKEWVVAGWAGMSHIRGTTNRMWNVQRNSLHYFQRPDASHVSVDSTATSLTGFSGRVALNKQKGNMIFNTAIGFIDPRFDCSDAGFMWGSDLINGHVILGYKWVQPGWLTRHAEFHFAHCRSYDFDGNQTYGVWFHWGFLRFLNYWSLNYMLAYNPEVLDHGLTRGGPLTLDPKGLNTWFGFSSDNRKKLVFDLGGGTSDYASVKSWNVNGGLQWKPTTSLSLRIGPSYSDRIVTAQWVDAFDDPTATETFGRRYVFARLAQKTVSASIRLNWTFTPKLSLQFYAQPFVSVGDYEEFKELDRPKSYDFNIYGEGASTFDGETFIADPDGPEGPAAPIELWNPDFNFKSLRGNMVLRWEYLPGSILYLVWTQNRSDVTEDGSFQFRRDMGDLWTAKPDNIFMIKATFWMSL